MLTGHPVANPAIYFPVGAIVGILPDLDAKWDPPYMPGPNGAPGRIPWNGKPPLWARLCRSILGPHRGSITHSLLGLALGALGYLWIAHHLHLPVLLAAAAAAGQWSHLFADSFTSSGVGLLFPVSKKRFRLASIRTGRWQEAVLTIAVVLGTLAWQLGGTAHIA